MSAIARLHVERTDDPAVMCWVVHDPAVAAAGDGVCAPDPASALGPLLAAGRVRSVRVVDGDVLVEVDGPSVVTQVHAAITADLATRAGWLTDRHCPLPDAASAPTPLAVSSCGACRHC